MNNPAISEQPFRLKFWPIAIAVVIGLGMELLASTGETLTIFWLHRHVQLGGNPT
jgi:hypothetical protein